MFQEKLLNIILYFAEQETRLQRLSDVHTLIYRIPKTHFDMLRIIIEHLRK